NETVTVRIKNVGRTEIVSGFRVSISFDLRVQEVHCENVTSGQVVITRGLATEATCTSAGLQVNPNDVISITTRGFPTVSREDIPLPGQPTFSLNPDEFLLVPGFGVPQDCFAQNVPLGQMGCDVHAQVILPSSLKDVDLTDNNKT